MNPRLTTLAAHVGGRLRTHRTELGLSPTALAAKTGYDLADLESYERGDKHIPAETLIALSKALDVPLLSFFEGIEGGITTDAPVGHPAAPVPEARELVLQFSQIEDPSMRQLILQVVAAYGPGR